MKTRQYLIVITEDISYSRKDTRPTGTSCTTRIAPDRVAAGPPKKRPDGHPEGKDRSPTRTQSEQPLHSDNKNQRQRRLPRSPEGHGMCALRLGGRVIGCRHLIKHRTLQKNTRVKCYRISTIERINVIKFRAP